MSVSNIKLKVSENKASASVEFLKYNIDYGISKSENDQRKNSYTIISALKGSSNLMMEVNTSLFSLPENQREAFTMDFIKYIKSKGLDFHYRKIPNGGSQSFFGRLFSFGGKASDAHQVLANISGEVWSGSDFINAIPYYGVKYYIFKDDAVPSKVMEDMHNGQLLDYEIYEYFKLIVFDSCSFGQMGVFTDSLSLEDVKAMLV